MNYKNYKNHYKCTIYTENLNKASSLDAFIPLFNSGFKDFMNNDSKKQRLLKRGFIVRIDVFLKTAFLK